MPCLWFQLFDLVVYGWRKKVNVTFSLLRQSGIYMCVYTRYIFRDFLFVFLKRTRILRVILMQMR
jgi:hypothetical protein